jgi:hypothetical protein
VVLLVLWVNIFREKKRLRIAGVVLVAVPVVMLGAFNLFVASHANYHQSTRRGTVNGFGEDTALRFLHEEVEADEEVFVYPYYPMYYFLAALRNPTRYSILMYHINTETQFAEAVADLERRQVRYVLWDTVVDGPQLATWFPGYRHPKPEDLHLERYLESHYETIELREGFRILRRREIRTRVSIPKDGS